MFFEPIFHDTLSEPETASRGDKDPSQVTSGRSKHATMLAATVCMTLASAAKYNASLLPQLDSSGSNSNELTPSPQELCFFDAEDLSVLPKLGHVMHLSIDYQAIVGWGKGSHAICVPSSKVNALLSDLDCNLLVGKSETFNTLTCALTTVEKM